MAKLAKRRSLARSLALLKSGLTVQQATAELRRRYHPSASLAEVQKAYFPTRPIPIAQQQGKSRREIVQTLEKLNANAERAREIMARLHSNPAFAAAHAQRARKTIARLHSDPEFAAAHAERMRRRHLDPAFAAANAERMARLNRNPKFAAANAERMRKRHLDPAFAAAHAERIRRRHLDPAFAAANAERMAQLHRNPVFKARLLAGIAKFWNAYRAAKQSALHELGYGEHGGERGRRIVVERTTPEELAALNEQHSVISMAVSRLPLLHQAVVASHFDLDHFVPSKHVQRAKTLSPAKWKKVLQQALAKLRLDNTLKKTRKK